MDIKTMRKLFLKSGDQRGVAAVEFAIVLPILLLLFAGITEFGIAYYNKQVITNASREGARAGSTSNCQNSAIEHAVRDYIIGGHSKDGDKNRLITFGDNDFNQNYDQYIDIDNTGNICEVSVNFQYDYLIFSMFVNLFHDDADHSLDISSITAMKIL